MKKTVLAITVSTLEALLAAAKNGDPVIYMYWLFYESYRAEILQIMGDHGYTQADFPACNGVFFARPADHQKYYVADPCNIY